MILFFAQMVFQETAQGIEKFQPFILCHALRQCTGQGVIGDFLKIEYNCVDIGILIQPETHESVIFFHKTMGVSDHVCYKSLPDGG